MIRLPDGNQANSLVFVRPAADCSPLRGFLLHLQAQRNLWYIYLVVKASGILKLFRYTVSIMAKAKKMGRPTIPEEERRTAQFLIRCSAAELEIIKGGTRSARTLGA